MMLRGGYAHPDSQSLWVRHISKESLIHILDTFRRSNVNGHGLANITSLRQLNAVLDKQRTAPKRIELLAAIQRLKSPVSMQQFYRLMPLANRSRLYSG